MPIAIFRLGTMRDTPIEFAIQIDTVDQNINALVDDLFVAANRIRWVDEDIDALPHAHQKRVRRLIEQFQAPSMSVGDSIDITIDGGLRKRRFECAPVGWIITDMPND